MFSLKNQAAKLTNVNPRAELHGQDKKLAVDLKFEIKVSNDVLSEFDPSLKGSLYKKADAMAETINAIAGLCTYQHESKEDFIGRVRAVLGDDPDLRVSSVRKERDDLLEQLKQVEALSEVRLSQRDELLAALELMLERISEPPEANCSCHLSPPCADCSHLSPPCADCIDFGGEREAFEEAKSAIARAKGGAA